MDIYLEQIQIKVNFYWTFFILLRNFCIEEGEDEDKRDSIDLNKERMDRKRKSGEFQESVNKRPRGK